MQRFVKLSCALAAVSSLAACGAMETVGGLAAVGAAITGFVTAGSENKDYTKYADTCKVIIASSVKAASVESSILVEAAKTEATGVLIYMAMKPKEEAFARCALAVPKSFLTQLAENGSIPNFVATIYGINRDSQNASRSLAANKEISLANMQHQQAMSQLQNALLTRLSSNTLDAIDAVKPIQSTTVVTP